MSLTVFYYWPLGFIVPSYIPGSCSIAISSGWVSLDFQINQYLKVKPFNFFQELHKVLLDRAFWVNWLLMIWSLVRWRAELIWYSFESINLEPKLTWSKVEGFPLESDDFQIQIHSIFLPPLETGSWLPPQSNGLLNLELTCVAYVFCLHVDDFWCSNDENDKPRGDLIIEDPWKWSLSQ